MGLKRDLQSASAWETELNRERAGALGMTAKKLEMLLAECKALGEQIDGLSLGSDLRELLLSDYRKTREEAERQRWNLCVQREAMGLRRHEDVDRHYPPVARR